MSYELISFDCYGTLIDWRLGMKKALRELAEKKNISIDIKKAPEKYIKIELEVERERYRKYSEILTISLKRLLKEVELNPEEEKIFVNTLPKWPPFPETREVLRELKNRGYKLAILSNIDEDMIKESIDLMGIEFDCVITAEQTRSYKPSLNHWKRMLETDVIENYICTEVIYDNFCFKIPKEKILHVAASYVHDIIPAHELGIKTAWINRNKEKRERIDYEFDNLKPLTEIL